MKRAYVLLNVEIDSKIGVLDYLKEIPGVKETHQLYGVYDIIILIEAETIQDLKDLINNRIKVIEKIRSTLSMICIE